MRRKKVKDVGKDGEEGERGEESRVRGLDGRATSRNCILGRFSSCLPLSFFLRTRVCVCVCVFFYPLPRFPRTNRPTLTTRNVYDRAN